MLVMVVFFIAFRWIHLSTPLIRLFLLVLILLLMPTLNLDRKSGSAGMPRPISYAVFCLKKKRTAGGARESQGHCGLSSEWLRVPGRTGGCWAASAGALDLQTCGTH